MTRNMSSAKCGICTRKRWIIMSILFLEMAMLLSNPSNVRADANRPEEKKLYTYSNRELAAFFKNIGYKDFWYNDISISRNSDGTVLRFVNKEKKKILVANCDGSITIIDSPGDQVWLDDSNKPVIWLTWSSDKISAHYANGMSEKMPFAPDSGHDPSGRYFMKDAPEKHCYTTIYSTERPDIPLIKVNLCGDTRLFVKNKKIYLLGERRTADDVFVTEVRIFQEKERLLEQVDSIFVPKPDTFLLYFRAEDLSPWDDEILYLDVHDFPYRSIWYSFNLKTRQLNKVSKAPFFGGHAFYLQCDIIEQAQKRAEGH